MNEFLKRHNITGEQVAIALACFIFGFPALAMAVVSGFSLMFEILGRIP